MMLVYSELVYLAPRLIGNIVLKVCGSSIRVTLVQILESLQSRVILGFAVDEPSVDNVCKPTRLFVELRSFCECRAG
jgi:hypothetical protein